MKIDIEKEIEKVLKQFKTELKASKVVDKDNNVTDKKAFAKLIDQNIKRLNDLEKYVANEAGVITDRYGADVLFSNVQLLKDMKQNGSLNPNVNTESIRQGQKNEEERFSKQHKLFGGISNLFNKFKSPSQNTKGSR